MRLHRTVNASRFASIEEKKMGHSRCRGLLLGLMLSGFVVASGARADTKPPGKATPVKAEPAQKPASKPTPAVALPTQKPVRAAEKKLGPEPDKKTNAKVNSYIELLNKESENLSNLRNEWLSKIDPKQGPSCKENIQLERNYAPDDGRLDTYRKSLKEKPALQPDAAALKMVEALQDLRNIGSEPGPYTEYQGRSEPGAWCKKLKDAYPRMLAIFDKYKKGERDVREYVDNFTDERDLRKVQTTLKKYGKHYRYQFAALTLEGKNMIRSIGSELRKDQPDPEFIKQRFDAFFAITDETRAMMEKEPPKQKTEPYPSVFMFFLVESVPKIKRGSTGLLEALAMKPDKRRDDRIDSEWKGVVGSYNKMIDYMNQVEFETKQK